MNPEAVQLCNDILGLIARAKASLVPLAEAHNLTPVQLLALHAIWNGDNTMGRVATALHCDASNVTGIVDRLTASQLITRQESQHDRRIKTLQLTPAGHQAITRIHTHIPLHLGYHQLTATERGDLHRLLGRLLATPVSTSAGHE